MQPRIQKYTKQQLIRISRVKRWQRFHPRAFDCSQDGAARNCRRKMAPRGVFVVALIECGANVTKAWLIPFVWQHRFFQLRAEVGVSDSRICKSARQ
jgi:hypothetical protein